MSRIPIDHEKLAEFCRKNHIRRLALFGSVLRDDFRPDSDVDVLVEFEPDYHIGFFGLYDVEQELSKLFGGRQIDMGNPKFLNRWIRDKVLAEAEVQYEKR